MMPPHFTPEPTRQQLLRSLAREGRHVRLAVSNESAADWLVRIGPLARELNRQSQFDGDDAA